MNKALLSKILRHVFAFLLALVLFYPAALAVTLVTVRGVTKHADDSDYYTNLKSALVKELKEYAPSTGISEDFFDTAVDADLFDIHSRKYVEMSLVGEDTAALSGTLRSDMDGEFYTKLEDYAKTEGFVLTDEVKAALSHLSGLCADKYVEYACPRITGLLFSVFGRALRLADKYALLAFAVLAAIMSVCVWGTLRLSKSARFKPLAASVLAGGLMCLALPLVILLGGTVDKLNITSAAMMGLIKAVSYSWLWAMIIIGAVLSVLSLILIVIKLIKEKNHSA